MKFSVGYSFEPGRKCAECDICDQIVKKTVRINPDFRNSTLSLAGKLDSGLLTGSHWL